jgi:FAD:protein FMN transferase
MSKMSIEQGDQRYALSGPTMGTRYSAVFYAADHFDTAPLAAALLAAVDQVDRQMSTWKPDSDLNRLNRAPLGEWVSLPRALMSVLDTGLRIGQRSGGAFDIGVGEHVAAWGFGANAAPESARPSAAMATRPAVELDLVHAGARRIAPASFDLSGIAKGYGVDELARIMNAFGMARYLVGIDGEMRGKGTKPDGTPWMVAHERPVPGIREAMGAIELPDLAVATSGNYRHFHVIDGKTISHSIDPRSGLPVENGIASVTVLAKTCMEADAWATALLVKGPETGLPLARVLGMDAIFVHADGTVTASL